MKQTAYLQVETNGSIRSASTDTFSAPAMASNGNDEVATRLRRVVSPLILRRLKSDPTIIQDLPPKNEMKVVCTLTREQATLYKAVVDEELRRIETSEGIERRGRVLALLTLTKQICNHPAQYLGEHGPLPKRSGKLDRITEMLEEALAAGDKALVLTQFREMGDKLVEQLASSLGVEVADTHDVPAIKLGKLKASDYDKPRDALPSLSFAFDAPATHGAVLRQLGEPVGWDDESSPAEVLAPLVRAAAEVARRIAMGEPSETEGTAADTLPTESSAKSRSPARPKNAGKRTRT